MQDSQLAQVSWMQFKHLRLLVSHPVAADGRADEALPDAAQQGWTGQKKARLVVGEDPSEGAGAGPEQAPGPGSNMGWASAGGASASGAPGSGAGSKKSSAQQKGKQPLGQGAAEAEPQAWTGDSRPLGGGRQGTYEAGSSSSHPGSSSMPAGTFSQDRPQKAAEEKRPRKIASDIPGDIVTVTVASGRRVYCPLAAPPQEGQAFGDVSWRSRAYAPGVKLRPLWHLTLTLAMSTSEHEPTSRGHNA